jgi:ketosteroid isomerase-like protein
MTFTGPFEDRLAIRELYSRYGDASTRGNLVDWLACWTEDGQWNTHFFKRSGKDDLRVQWDASWVNFDKVVFLGDVSAIDVKGDTAAARSIAQESIRLKSGGLYRLSGRYEDLLVRKNGEWLFARRDYQPLIEELPE